MKVAYIVCVILSVCVHKTRAGLVKEVPTIGNSQQGYGQNVNNGIPQYTQYTNIAGNNIGQGFTGQQYGSRNPFVNKIAENVAREIQKAKEVANNINRDIFQSINRYNGYYNNYFNNYYNQLNRTPQNGYSVPQYGNYVPQNGGNIYNNHQVVVEKSTAIYPKVTQNNNTPRADGNDGRNNYNLTVIVEKATTIYPKLTENNNTPLIITNLTKTVTDIPQNTYDCNNPPIDIRIENSNDGKVTCIVENDDTSTKLTSNKDKPVAIITNNRGYSTHEIRVDVQSTTTVKTVTNETQVPSTEPLSTTIKSHIKEEVTTKPQKTTTFKTNTNNTLVTSIKTVETTPYKDDSAVFFRDSEEEIDSYTSTGQRSLVNVTSSTEPCVPPLVRDPKSGSCVPRRDNFNGGCPSGKMRSSDDSCQDIV